ncbi:hypothetical protein [Anaerotignum propionicum]|uniref:hypothetical protein n=1 Tax=Anaerotignum propionicum TaxID=28446 RepID=UPI00289A07AA|nr:hypothetical protein [Anaerotignum propionicum]
MMEYRYSTKSPAHGQNIETRKTQSFKYDGVTYSGPMFYCTRCRKHYLVVEGSSSFNKLKSTAPSGLPIDIRKGVVNKTPVKKKGVKAEQPKQEGYLQNETMQKKKSGGKKGKAARKALIERNKETKKRLQESINQIRCEMICPKHVDRVMNTKKCIDVEKHKSLPLFYCIDCKKYYVSCTDLKVTQLGRWSRKDFFNCDCEIITTNPKNGKLINIGSFSSTAELEKSVSAAGEEAMQEKQIVEEDILKIQSETLQTNHYVELGKSSDIEVIKPKKKTFQIEKPLIENKKKKQIDEPKEIVKIVSTKKMRA